MPGEKRKVRMWAAFGPRSNLPHYISRTEAETWAKFWPFDARGFSPDNRDQLIKIAERDGWRVRRVTVTIEGE